MIRVVAAALIRDRTVLAARRRRPDGWEFPGGKVEPGEADGQALRRECSEELGVEVAVGPWRGAATGGGGRLGRGLRGENGGGEDRGGGHAAQLERGEATHKIT